VPAKEDVHVQHVDLREAVSQRAATESSEGGRIAPAQDVVARRREGPRAEGRA
jgi:hypothetical protein